MIQTAPASPPAPQSRGTDRHPQEGWQDCGCCWIGGTRYSRPLNPTDAKKWQMIAGSGIDNAFVIGFSTGLWPECFSQHARFYLLPRPPSSLMRYAVFTTAGAILALRLILTGRVRVLIAQSPYEGAIGAFVKKVAGIFGRRMALIVESHGDFENALFSYRRVPFPRLYRAVMRSAARYAFRHADVLRAISSSTHEQLNRWAAGKPVVVFPTWTDTSAFAGIERSVPLAETHEIVFAGSLIPLKGVHFLLDALAQSAGNMPDVHLWIIGQADNTTYSDQLREQVSRLNLSGRVTFVGRVDQAELAHYMARARVLVLPSISEGLGRVVVEAMLCGTPVIGSRVGGIPDLIEDGVTGYLVPPGDVDALSGALEAIYSNPNIEAMGQAAREFALRFFSPEGYVNGYRQLFEHAQRILRGESS